MHKKNETNDMFEENIFIFGHKNPDTDSVCSAIGYSHLKKLLGYKNAKACILGDLNKETNFVLNKFNINNNDDLENLKPRLLEDIKLKVRDLNIYRPNINWVSDIEKKTNSMIKKNDKTETKPSVFPLVFDSPLKMAWDYLKISNTNASRLIPILDPKNNQLLGIISLSDITRIFMDGQSTDFAHEIFFENLLKIIKGELIAGSYGYEKIEGNLFVSSTTIPPKQKMTDKDIVVTAQIKTAKEYALSKENTCGCVILVRKNIKKSIFKDSKTAVVFVKESLYNTIVLLKQAISVGAIMKNHEIFKFYMNDYVEDVAEYMKISSHRNFPVIDNKGEFAGIISRRHLLNFNKKKVILVDHNEKKQSIDGIEEANIIEIIDHHRVDDVETELPLFIRSEPVGCTATIVFDLFVENKKLNKMGKRVAGLLLSAILSDTLIFASPTCTEKDRKAARKLAEIAFFDSKIKLSLKEIDDVIEEYGKEMLDAGTNLEGLTAKDILFTDMKFFNFGSHRTSISQINTTDFRSILQKKNELIEAMEEFRKERELNIVVLMITHIILKGSEVLIVGDHTKFIVAESLEFNHVEDGRFFEGVVSRKKQMVPKLATALQI